MANKYSTISAYPEDAKTLKRIQEQNKGDVIADVISMLLKTLETTPEKKKGEVLLPVAKKDGDLIIEQATKADISVADLVHGILTQPKGEIPKKGFKVILVEEADEERIKDMAKKHNVEPSILIKSCLAAIVPDMYLIKLSEPDTITAASNAVKKYMEDNKIEKLEDDKFITEVCNVYISKSNLKVEPK